MAAGKAEKELCPSCGEPTKEGFDGGNDMPYEFCDRVTPLLSGDALKAWSEEHDKRCRGHGKCNEGPPVKVCDFYAAPPRWLAAALAEAG